MRTRPNIIVVTFHDLGRHVSPYGVGTVRTPAFDRLAARGATFEAAFATAPQCSPSRASLATGLYPQRHGVLGLAHEPFGWDMLPDVRHVAQLLGERNYETHQFGFQHVTMQPERMGFERRHGRQPGVQLRERVAEFIRTSHWTDHAPARYLEVNVEEPHRPFGQGDVAPDDSLGVTVPGWLPDTAATRADLAALQGAIADADATLGAILDAIDDAGIAENTIVVAVADHGIALARAKCTLYDAGLEITLIIAQPGRVPAGSRVTAPTSMVDVLPTIFDVAGLDAPGGIDGVSQAAAMAGAGVTSRHVFAQKTFHTYFDPMRCVRTPQFKLIRNFDAGPAVEVPLDVLVNAPHDPDAPCRSEALHPPVELYDLESDPHELHDVSGDARFTQARRELDAALLAWMRRVDDPLLRGTVPTPPAFARRLAAFVGDAAG